MCYPQTELYLSFLSGIITSEHEILTVCIDFLSKFDLAGLAGSWRRIFGKGSRKLELLIKVLLLENVLGGVFASSARCLLPWKSTAFGSIISLKTWAGDLIET